MGHGFFRSAEGSRRGSAFDAEKKDFPAARLCKVLDVSPSSYSAWKNRPVSTRLREDLVLLAHVRPAFSHETYGSPRMTHELREQGAAELRRAATKRILGPRAATAPGDRQDGLSGRRHDDGGDL